MTLEGKLPVADAVPALPRAAWCRASVVKRERFDTGRAWGDVSFSCNISGQRDKPKRYATGVEN